MGLHWHQLCRLWADSRLRQAASLYIASFAGIPLAIFTSIVFTRFLGPQAYGDFAFLDSLFDVARVVFPLGFFYAGNRALVMNHDKEAAREYYGATLLLLFALFLLMALLMGLYGLTDGNLAEKGLDRFFLWLLPFGWIFLMTPYFDNLLHADKRIHELAATRFFPKIITFAVALAVHYFLADYGGNRLAIVWAAYLGAFMLIYVSVLLHIRVSFRRVRQRLHELLRLHRSYGIHLYAGSLVSLGSVALTGVLISYFSDDNSGVGFFMLAIAISRPLALVPGALADTWFKDFASQKRISPQLLGLTLLLSLFGLLALFVLAGPFVRLAYSEEFLPVIRLAYLAGMGMCIYGMAGFFNRFLEAHGRGKAVRNTLIATGLGLLAANLLLIPPHGATGAALAMILSSTLYLGGMAWAYFRQGSSL